MFVEVYTYYDWNGYYTDNPGEIVGLCDNCYVKTPVEFSFEVADNAGEVCACCGITRHALRREEDDEE